MAAELSKRSDDDRRRKLQLQEEADLAYAIALSKAEAASLKTNWIMIASLKVNFLWFCPTQCEFRGFNWSPSIYNDYPVRKISFLGPKIGARLYLSFAKTVHVGVVENPFVEIND